VSTWAAQRNLLFAFVESTCRLINWGICRNSRQIFRNKWRKYENTAKFGHPKTETIRVGDGRNSGSLSLITNEGKVVCLRSSPTKEQWCVFVYRQWWNSGMSSPITNDKTVVCLRLSPMMEQRCVFVYHQQWNSCLRPSQMTKQWCVFVYHQLWNSGVFVYYQRWKSYVSSLVMKGVKNKWIPIF
jgi:hypothetical protein